MDKKFPFPTDPKNWQEAYTADNAYYDAEPISRRASLLGLLALITVLVYSIVYLFSWLPPTSYWFNLVPGFVGNLNENNLTEPIREAFKDQERYLTANAAIQVVKPGQAWVIKDGNIQYFIYNEPPDLNIYDKQYYCFSLMPEDVVSALDKEQLNDTVREAFKNKGWVITDKAKIKAEQPGNTWIIKEEDMQYFIRNEQQNINVYARPILFILASKTVHMLNSGQLTDPIYKAFDTYGKPLTDKAAVTIELPGSAWVIVDGKARFFVRNEQPNVNVYEEQHLFSLDNNSTAALDTSQLTDPVREVFRNHEKPLTTAALVQVMQPGSAWVIIDGSVQYIVKNEQQNIKVYGKQNIFSPSSDSISILDTGKLHDSVHEAFIAQGTPLTSSATVTVKEPGNLWVITDANTQYFVRNEEHNINVYKKLNGALVLAAIFAVSIVVYIVFKLIKRKAFLHAQNFFSEFYLPPTGVDPSEVIDYRISSRVKLPTPFGELFPSVSKFKNIRVQNGEILNGGEWPAWMARNLGGPIFLIVFDGSALYIERGDRFSRVVGPGVSFLEHHETVKYAVDLRTKSNTGNFDVWTKDGISINLTARIEYRISDPQKTNPKLVYPFDPVAVKKAIERHSLRWPDPTKEPGESTWEDAAWGQVTGVLPSYIGSRFLDDLLIADRNGGQILSPDAANEIFVSLNNATIGFGVYVTDFQILSIKLPQEVEDYYVKYWEAERQGIATLMDGQARAFDIRAREKVRADAQHDLILVIANGLRKNVDKDGQFTDALLLSLSEILDHGLNDPYMRSSTGKETLESLEILQNLLKKPSS